MPRIILLISCGISLSSCVTPPDIPACRSLTGQVIETKDDFGIPVRKFISNPVCMEKIGEPECGRCSWSITEKEQYVGEAKSTRLNKKPWSQVKQESVLLPSESAAKMKAYIIENCKKHQECNKDIAKWRIKLDALDSLGAALPDPKPKGGK